MALLAGISACGVARISDPPTAASASTATTTGSTASSSLSAAAAVTVPPLSSAVATAPATPTPSSTTGDVTSSLAPVSSVTAPTTAPSAASSSSSPTTSTAPTTDPTEQTPTSTGTKPGAIVGPTTRTSLPRQTPTTTTPALTTKVPSTSTKTPPATTTTKAPTTTTAPSTTKSTTTPAPPLPFKIPVTVGNATQVITVVASSSSSTTAVLTAWQRASNGTWSVAFGPYQAWVGSAGIGHQSEGSTKTPIGTFTLTEAFGRLANPGTALPYHLSQPNDWWVSDVNSKYYNTLQNCVKSACPFNTSVSEHIYYETPYYNYAVVMDVNRWPAVPGAGSAFFLHVTDHSPTAGCVAIDQSNLIKIMRWLDPAQHPRIADGIG